MSTDVIEVAIAVPTATIWPALRDPALIAQWHGWETDDGSLAAEIDLIYVQGAEIVKDGRVLKLSGGDVFELSDVEGGSRLRITRAAYDPDWEWAIYYDDITAGWVTFTQQLRFWLERQPGETRRTLFYSSDVDPHVVLPPAAPPWFETEHQRGVVLDELGPGLLIVARNPKPDSTGVTAVVTTFGLDDEQLVDARRVWDAWWATGV